MDAQSRLACALFFCALRILAAAEPQLLWREPLGGTVIGGFSAMSGSVAAVCDGGSVKVFGTGGRLLWDHKETGRFLPFLTRSRDAACYFARTSGDLVALNLAGGLQWRLSLDAPIVAPVVCGWDGRVFVALEKKIICLSTTGRRLWQYNLKSPAASDPQLDGAGGITFLLKDNTLLALGAFGEATEIKLFAAPAFVLPVSTPRPAS